jgi:hypothetical protein
LAGFAAGELFTSAKRRSISSLMCPSCPWIGVIHNRGHAKGPDAFASGPFKDW